MNNAIMSTDDDRLIIKIGDRSFNYIWPPNSDQTKEIAEQLAENESHISGIFAVLPTDSKERLNTTFKNIGKSLSENLNCPIEYMTQKGKACDLSKREAKRDTWTIDYYGYDPGVNEYSVETLLTIGNGFIGIRGAMPEMRISDDQYPATYLAGLYNDIPSTVSGKKITNEDIVNAPNLQFLTVEVDGETIDYSSHHVKELERHLDLKTGLFSAKAAVKYSSGKELVITTKKFVSMADRNRYAVFYDVDPVNFSGEITVISEADGDVFNYNVERYRSLNSHHLIIDEVIAEDNYARLVASTTSSHFAVVQESKLLSDCDLKWKSRIEDKKIIQEVTVDAKEGRPITLEKLIYVEKVPLEGNEDPRKVSDIDELSTFEDMYAESSKSWQELWQKMDIKIEGDMMAEKLLHFHAYHLMVSASPLSAKDIDASIAARGLHGEAYRGHIFWDELFIIPFYIMHFPETARELLMYRYRRLRTAKAAAEESGDIGAMYPWQSGLDGREQSQLIHLNPMSGNWDPDNSRLQRHVSLAIAYNIWLYYQNTGDIEFMSRYGLEMLLEITEFWMSKAEYAEANGHYSISGVMGPDEFHEGYPGSKSGGLRDNAYTNMMVAWLFGKVKELLSELPDAVTETCRGKTLFSFELEKYMEEIIHRFNLEVSDDGIIAQFAGYFDLREIDLEKYKKTYGDIQRMDRILKAEDRSPDGYQVAKQADSMMIFYNFSKENVDKIISDMGYDLPEGYFKKNLDYYIARTSHGSSLSRVVYAKLADMAGERDLSWDLYMDSLFSDYRDIQGGTVAEGIHTGVMASTIYITLSMFGGIDIRQDKLSIDPRLPHDWKKFEFNLERKGITYNISVYSDNLEITSDHDAVVCIRDIDVFLTGDKKETIFLQETGR